MVKRNSKSMQKCEVQLTISQLRIGMVYKIKTEETWEEVSVYVVYITYDRLRIFDRTHWKIIEFSLNSIQTLSKPRNTQCSSDLKQIPRSDPLIRSVHECN